MQFSVLGPVRTGEAQAGVRGLVGRVTEQEGLIRSDPRERVESLTGTARAEQLAGSGAAARATRAEAARAAVAADDVLRAARAITSVTPAMVWSDHDHEETDEELVTLIRHTLERLPADEPALRARLLSTLAAESAVTLDPLGAIDAAEEAIAIARRLGDDELLALSLAAASLANRRPDRFGRLLELGRELDRLGAGRGMPGVHALGLLVRSACLFAHGRLDSAMTLVEEVELLTRTYELSDVAALPPLAKIGRRLAQGDEAGAEAALRAIVVAPDLSRRPRAAMFGLLCLRYAQGRFGEVEEHARRAGRSNPAMGQVLMAHVLLGQGRWDAAAALLLDPPEPRLDALWLCNKGMRADGVVALGLREAAGPLYEELLPYAERTCGGETGMFPIGPVAARLARLAELLGRPSAEHWRGSLEVAELARAPRWIAEAHTGLERAC
ncbi:hypothetical protein ACFOY2_41940 [Nonomuraea purpurea]|uniref:Tetratricopeptide repeat protein n=1 Tax=Nonomuraea purpurea TaxID=1849276 RepID=A0ABV8GIS7_9ACTN